jgi:hypothetical protein
MRIRRSAWITLVFAILAVSTASLPSLARTWHVEPDSIGSTAVIRAAIDSAAPGDTVLVGPGTYLETEDLETWIWLRAGVALVGEEGAEATRIEYCGVTYGITLAACEGARVSGFTVQFVLIPGCGGPGSTAASGIWVWDCTDAIVEECIIDDTPYSGIRVEGESSEWWKPVIRNNVIRNCDAGIICDDVNEPGRPYFVGNTVTGCRWGVEVHNSAPYFEGCEITHCREFGMMYVGHCGGDVSGSVIAHNESRGISVSTDPPIASPGFNGSWLPGLANDIYDNGSWDIYYYHTGPDAPLMAIYNCWHAECPNFATRVHGNVMYIPWLDSTHTKLIYTVDCAGPTEASTWGSIKAMFR